MHPEILMFIVRDREADIVREAERRRRAAESPEQVVRRSPRRFGLFRSRRPHVAQTCAIST